MTHTAISWKTIFKIAWIWPLKSNMIYLMKFYLLLTGKYLDFTFQRLMIAQLLKYPWFFFKSSDDLKKRVTKKKFTFSKKFKWFEFANLRIIRFLSTTLKCHIVSYTMCYSQLIQNEFVLQNSWRKFWTQGAPAFSASNMVLHTKTTIFPY